jgi:hypothetical protein
MKILHFSNPSAELFDVYTLINTLCNYNKTSAIAEVLLFSLFLKNILINIEE